MARLSHYAPGEYRPIAMKFDGPTGGFVKEHNPVGQTVWSMGRFKIPKFSGPTFVNGSKVILHAAGNGNLSLRLGLGVCAASRLIQTENNRMYFSVQNSTPASIALLFSNMEVTDDAWHSFLCSFNATTAEFVFKVDGMDADDTTQAGRILGTGVMTTTASSLIHVGENLNINTTFTNHWSGEISVFAYGEGFRSNWDDFFFPNNLPKRLDHVGWTEFGAGVYAFPYTLFDGTTNYYNKTYTSTGNKVTSVVLFKILPHSTNFSHIITCDGSSQARLGLTVAHIEHTSVNEQGKLVMYSLSSTGTPILRLITPNVVNDGQWHIVFASYDADLGQSIFYMDGVNVDDTLAPTRVGPAVATLQSGATSRIAVGRYPSGSVTSGKACSIAYCGHKDAYMTNWIDFMTYDGKPREIDEDTWRQWRGQPKFWQSAGVMNAVNIKSSEGPMTANGTFVINGGSMPLVYHPYCDMENNLGLIGRMRRGGKCAPIVSGVLLRGTKDAPQNNGGVVLHFANPRQVISSVIYDRSYFQQIADGVGVTFSTGWSIDANGYAYRDGTFSDWLQCTDLPAKASTVRAYRLDFRFEDAAPPGSSPGCLLLFNFQDTSNYWRAIFYWNGSAWRLDIGDVIAGVWTSRAGVTLTTTVNVPMHANLTVFDGGDDLHAFIQAYEVDVPADQYGASINYSVASRALKTLTTVWVRHQEDPDTHMRYRSFMVMDM